VLFESRNTLGGHAHTVPVLAGGQEVLVDVGAQFFARGPHPTYTKLLELLGLLDAGAPEHDATLDVEMTITVTRAGEANPRLVSPSRDRVWPVFAPWNRSALAAFLGFTRAAERLSRDGDWDLPLGSWLDGLRLAAEQREGLLLPLLAAMVGCTTEQARALSARGAVLFIAKALPEKLLDPVLYGNSLLGLQGNVERLAAECHGLTTHAGLPVSAVRRRFGGGFRIHAGGLTEDVDLVVFAAPPHATAPLLADLILLAGAARVLEDFEYFTAEVSVHRDPVYMPENPRHWSAYNAQVDGVHAEGSVWYGALRPVPTGDEPLSLFKSWATARAQPPQDEILRRAFRHPLVTPAFLRSQRRLARFQGRAGVYFAGSYTREVDSQETALVSAMDVARAIAPSAPNLAALQG
jgi:predicted NAD/FAD-binding protein